MVKRIRDTSPKPRKIDPACVAKQLGAEEVKVPGNEKGLIGYLACRTIIAREKADKKAKE